MKGYYNLGVVAHHTEQRSEYSLDEIENELKGSKENWITVRNTDTSISFVKNESISLNCKRSSIEILLVAKPENRELKILRDGFCIPVEELKLDKELKFLSIIDQIQLIARFIDSSSLCCGFPVTKESNNKGLPGTTVLLAVGSIGQLNGEIVFRMFSGKCNIITPESQCCSACTSAKKNEETKSQEEKKKVNQLCRWE